MERIAVCQTISSEKTDIVSVLDAFCRQKHRLDVMECVNHSTQGQALEPWNDCLNPDKDLTKKEVADLACRILYSEFKNVLRVLSDCVEEMVSSSDAETWMSILKSCAYKTDTTANGESASGNTVRSS
ncbi:uncharacterized protein TNCV_4374551 [Trichonephila clavipes]|uniref:Uncharacterized protein n=1 Tax=Trichonephila clavipes TaxID=2585209 RepID=A0A8X6UQ35_TRICX|nr:uncharacterized protein TNCV_4374551 [Trichonephila clavipes]